MRNSETLHITHKPETVEIQSEAPKILYRPEISLGDHALRTTVRSRIDALKEQYERDREEIIDDRPETD